MYALSTSSYVLVRLRESDHEEERDAALSTSHFTNFLIEFFNFFCLLMVSVFKLLSVLGHVFSIICSWAIKMRFGIRLQGLKSKS